MPFTVLIRLNVISTRFPMATVLGSTSVISQRKRPPPSKSTTAATIGGLKENASRSTVYVAIVAGVSASRSCDIRSTAPHLTHTRAGGRCRVPHSSHREAWKANFHGSLRREAGATGGVGSGRLGGSRCNWPRHVRNLGYDS